ncbi:MAG: hypothetical protein HY006_01165 [Candidatus Sungbacteria bacterium]|nr:hypothetical protein [Candidatus Sungbacteria bacterium]
MYQRPTIWQRKSYDPKKRYAAKKPIRSFRDLEVYQKALDAAVVVAKDIYPLVVSSTGNSGAALPEYPFRDALLKLSLEIPRWIAELHALRFDFPAEGLTMLERARVGSNRMTVYLEQVRGIYADDSHWAVMRKPSNNTRTIALKCFALARHGKSGPGRRSSGAMPEIIDITL